ncbi:NEL-type E3 ubiquitin ligase domain-containing protein [Bordetella sp. LUAb4]|uniref:NEL-type E3 ubiquitin ligase domain-containing protein n=1 Tax=Bordetella sp. LUAb4 TaxID=2843195 RepID=UPI001E45CB7B|nr:NEL-type E3 ubiquitin ligase domain-containing protein [Bordetella sp. LUAb4]
MPVTALSSSDVMWGLASDDSSPAPILCTDRVLAPWLPGSLPSIQYERMHAVLKRVSDDPNGRNLLQAYATWASTHDRTPDIIWRKGGEPRATAQDASLGAAGGMGWLVDLDYLAQASPEDAVKELANRFKDVTNVQFGQAYASLAVDHPLLAIEPELERKWNEWLTAAPEGASRQARQLAIERMRECLVEMRCYGGLDHGRFLDLLKVLSAGQRDTPCIYMSLDLAHLGLDSIPPIPPSIDAVNLSGNMISDWSNMPSTLRALELRGHQGTWPLDVALPVELVELDLSESNLADAPAAFLESLYPLPYLVSLSLRDTNISVLPRVANAVISLDISGNQFRALPTGLPPGLVFLYARGNPLEALPQDMSSLPAGLRCLYLRSASTQGLVVPEGLQRNANLYIELTPSPAPTATPLEVSLRDLLGDFLKSPEGCAPADAQRYQTAAAQWGTISGELVADHDRRLEVNAFCSFLKRLGQTPAYQKHENFRLGVREWIVDLAARPGLLDTTLGACLEATESCDDRIVLAYNRLMIHRLNSDIEEGLLDRDIPRVVDIARQVYTLGVLDDVAAQLLFEIRRDSVEAAVYRAGLVRPGNRMEEFEGFHYRTNGGAPGVELVGAPEALNEIRELEYRVDRRSNRDFVLDELEFRLALQCLVSAPDALDLWALAPERAMVESSQIDGERIRPLAVEEVRRRGAREFLTFLALDYAPWSQLLKRQAADAYAQAEAQLYRALEATFEADLDAAVVPVALGQDDGAARDDARKDAGPAVARRLRLDSLLPVTLGLLQGRSVNGTPIRLPFAAEPAMDAVAPAVAQAGWQRA